MISGRESRAARYLWQAAREVERRYQSGGKGRSIQSASSIDQQVGSTVSRWGLWVCGMKGALVKASTLNTKLCNGQSVHRTLALGILPHQATSYILNSEPMLSRLHGLQQTDLYLTLALAQQCRTHSTRRIARI